MLINHIRRTTNRYSHVKGLLSKAKGLALPSQLNYIAPKEHAVRTSLADELQLLPQSLYVNQTLSRALLHMDMLVQIAVVNQPVELRSGLISEASCSLTIRH